MAADLYVALTAQAGKFFVNRGRFAGHQKRTAVSTLRCSTMPSERVEGHFAVRIAEDEKYSVSRARIALSQRRIGVKERVDEPHGT